MKTVMDAVNEFKGEWPDCRVACLHYSNGLSAWAPSIYTYMNHFSFICSESQYSDLVLQLSTNFGESSLKHLYIWQEGIKRQPEEQPVFTQAMADNGKAYSQQKSVLMEESLMCIIDHLSECGISISNDYHAPSIDDLPEPQQKAKWVAMNALDRLVIDTRTDKEKAVDAIDKLITNAYQETTDNFVSDSRFRIEATHLMDEIIDGTVAGVKWVGE